MWGIHDSIRASLKEISLIIKDAHSTASPSLAVEIGNVVLPCLNEITEIAAQLEDPTASAYKEQSSQQDRLELDIGALTGEEPLRLHKILRKFRSCQERSGFTMT